MLNLPQHCICCFVVRHGTTELNSAGCFRGSIDVALDKQGTADAHKLASLFENIDISHIFASDRKRAMQTAKIISDRKHMSVTTSPNLRAWDVGEFSGEPKNKENRDKLEEFIDAPTRIIPEGESLAKFKSRVRPCIVEAIEVADALGEPTMVVAHSSIVHEVGDMFHDDHYALLVEPGGAIAIYIQDGQIKAQPIYRPRPDSIGAQKADVVS